MKQAIWLLLLVSLSFTARAQAREGTLSEKEVDLLRDAAAIPQEKVRAYLHILDDREKELDSLLARHRGSDFASEVHDVFEQMADIADELNDNLDTLAGNHRDLRKVLSKVVDGAERWSTALRAPPDNPRYDVERRIALDALKDTRSIAEKTSAEQAVYFKEHPEAAKEEKERAENPHAPR